jgi:hypothetical protein
VFETENGAIAGSPRGSLPRILVRGSRFIQQNRFSGNSKPETNRQRMGGNCFATTRTFQEIKCMMTVQTTHGLFLTCTQKLYLYIYISCNQLFGPNPFLQEIKKCPLTWKDCYLKQKSCSGTVLQRQDGVMRIDLMYRWRKYCSSHSLCPER